MNMKLRVLLGSLVGGGVLAVALTFLSRGHAAYTLIVGALVVFVAVPAGVVALLALLLSRYCWRNRLRWASAIAAACVGCVGMLLLFLPAGALLQEHDIATARQYCEDLVPLLDAHKQMTGSYPERLDDIVPGTQDIPRLLNNAPFYSTDGKTFTFTFEVPDGLLPTIHVFGGDTRDWREWS